MSLEVRARLRRGRLELEAELDVGAAETVALVGPNGAGKSSLLAAIAGLLRLDGGRIALGGQVLDGGPRGPFVPPEARGVGLVFQEHRLFAHLSALDNVAYGLRSQGRSRRAARAEAEAWLERVGLAVAHRRARPDSLSGGEAQRVALARALAAGPRLLLLDEPLAAVDASARLGLRRELHAHLASFQGPRLLVAHDITEALAFADRLVVLEAGRVVQAGRAADLLRRPRTRYVADLVGVNGFEGTCRAGVVRVGEAQLTVPTDLEGDVLVTVHPRAVSLYRERPSGSPRNVWRASVVGLEPLLDRARVSLGGPLPIVAEVTHAAVEELGLGEGGAVWVAVKATELAVGAR